MKGFEALYREHVHAVYRFAMSVTGRRDAAEDLTSEAFLALYRHLDSIDESRLPAWLLTVVRNRARDMWKHEAVEQRYAEQTVTSSVSVTPEADRWVLESADLKPVHRACLILRYVHGLARTEIAAATGLTETQVKGHLQYGLTLLRKAYKRGSAG
jgi:RNA polymerase sigma-70 factor (ECF subfamily)